MKNEQSDKLVRKKLASLETLPGSSFRKEAVWEMLENRLPEAKKKTRLFRLFMNMGIAAAILLAVVITGFFYEHSKLPQKTTAHLPGYQETIIPVAKQQTAKQQTAFVKQEIATTRKALVRVKKKPVKNRHNKQRNTADTKAATEWLLTNIYDPGMYIIPEMMQPGYTASADDAPENNMRYIVF